MANGYINIAHLYKRVPVLADTNGDHLVAVSDLRAAIALAAAETGDVVEVVRCKDCEYRNKPDCKMWNQCVICGSYHHWERDDYYCSYGARNDERQ